MPHTNLYVTDPLVDGLLVEYHDKTGKLTKDEALADYLADRPRFVRRAHIGRHTYTVSDVHGNLTEDGVRQEALRRFLEDHPPVAAKVPLRDDEGRIVKVIETTEPGPCTSARCGGA